MAEHLVGVHCTCYQRFNIIGSVCVATRHQEECLAPHCHETKSTPFGIERYTMFSQDSVTGSKVASAPILLPNI
jgi:hypothetical protein